MSLFSDLFFEARIIAQSLGDYVSGPHLRLGVTGLSRAGKTVFITALIDHLTKAARPSLRRGKNPLPVFRVQAEGRLTRGQLEPQPDDAVPRFSYENHLAALHGPGGDTDARHWPESTTQISELRLKLEFERPNGQTKALTIDIVDYPGEWLLDLPLLDKGFAQWSRETLEASSAKARAPLAEEWRRFVDAIDPKMDMGEETARRAAALFTAYLRACRAEIYAFSVLPPGRFLMPGDLAGSPALTFSPLVLEEGVSYPSHSLAGMMERRFEAYKTHIVKPFFRDHFVRLDRQIVLVDALSALNAGPAAVRDLENALSDILVAFRVGQGNLLTNLFRPKIDKILFAATKADHLHHTSHDRLEAILRFLTARAISRAEAVGTSIDVIAMAAVRATREAMVSGEGGSDLEAVIGVPLTGENIDGEIFDGHAEAAIFPGDLPSDPKLIFQAGAQTYSDYRFVRFRPPIAHRNPEGVVLPLPHIRLDRAFEFLLGDRLI
ncbi:YcjX family protein [Beijerinckia indica]|uniref:Amino acid regulated cytosolic protein n=1 Tax=Beijerinckia indica subsp. indica (strain ATCC 9039 / DSM 1715 / NCIMB 8712) TaxID=395963 RepID=B2IHX8_BEII9|nr:YcjX family protein [Beijerinckia indica]ACB96021.1 protein of unknown function DUF463 YcjX family protein [Beijerinckia indica subsp. indica ATCC 9039]